MKIIQPYDLKIITIESLINDKKILDNKYNKSWTASIFAKSKKLNLINTYDKDHIITQIDDILFDDFYVLDKMNQIVYLDYGTKRDYIQCKEIGDFNDSVKRYTKLNLPIDYNEDAQQFLNLPNIDFSMNSNLNITKELVFKSDIDIIMKKSKKNDIFDNKINHPHINDYNQHDNVSRYNNKAILIQVLKWAKDKGIKYIYCINEYRPNVINNQYVSSYVYYTINGSY